MGLKIFLSILVAASSSASWSVLTIEQMNKKGRITCPDVVQGLPLPSDVTVTQVCNFAFQLCWMKTMMKYQMKTATPAVKAHLQKEIDNLAALETASLAGCFSMYQGFADPTFIDRFGEYVRDAAESENSFQVLPGEDKDHNTEVSKSQQDHNHSGVETEK